MFTLRAQAIVQKFHNPRCCSNGEYQAKKNVKHNVWTYFAKSEVLKQTFTDKIALLDLISLNASGIGVLLLTFAAEDGALSTWG